MIKFISQKPRIEKDNILINQIKGYSDVKNDLCKHLKLLQYSAEHKNAQVISGFALIRKEKPWKTLYGRSVP